METKSQKRELSKVMEAYQNLGGDSPVSHYELGDDFIIVKFKGNGYRYKYSRFLSGERHIANMKLLAIAGKGLCSYINQNDSVKNRFRKF
jgi:hypothetical protein